MSKKAISMSLQKLLTGVLTAVIFIGCNGIGSSYEQTPEEKAAAQKIIADRKAKVDEIVAKLNSDPNSNNAWVIQQSYSNQSGYTILKGPGGVFYAVNINKFTEAAPIEQLVESNTIVKGLIFTRKTELKNDWRYETRSGSFCPSSESCSRKTTLGGTEYFEWSERVDFVKSVEKTYYIDPKNGIEFSEGSTSSRDFEAIGAALEEENLASMKEGLVSQFGLSERRASELASMANSMKNIADSQGRALTERDLESLEVKAMGASLADLKKAKANGDTKAIEKMTVKAASLNKISAEQAKRLMKQLGL